MRCPLCGTRYLYTTDYEYLTNGTEDEQTLRRLADDAADALRYLVATKARTVLARKLRGV